MIEAKGLRKRSGTRLVLDDVTFSVPAGEVFGLAGVNGAGKSMLVRILATLLAADEGEATVAGYSVCDQPEKVRAAVGYVPDVAGVYPRMTAGEYVEFYAAIHGLVGARRSKGAADVLELVGLAGKRHADVEGLSRGQRQRLSFGRALVHDPEVLLLDDDGAALDPSAQQDRDRLLGELQRMGKTILVSVHDLERAGRVCSRMGVLHGGTIVAVGPVSDVASAADSTDLAQAYARLTGQAPS